MWFTVVANVWVFLHRDINKITYLLKQPVVRMLHLPNSKRFKRYFSFYYHFIRFIRSSVLNIDEKKKCQWLWKPSVQIRVWSVFNFLFLRQMVCLSIDNKKNNKRKKAFCRNNCYRLFFFSFRHFISVIWWRMCKNILMTNHSVGYELSVRNCPRSHRTSKQMHRFQEDLHIKNAERRERKKPS